ncbi:MAG: HAD family hydrolase [Methanotrichaceae archaeon]
MLSHLAVVFDVAGTMLEMYRVAKDITRNILMTDIITTKLVMEKSGRALVVPHIDPTELMETPPHTSLSAFFVGRNNDIQISCSSTPVSEDEACSILLSSEVEVADVQETFVAVCAHDPQIHYTIGLIVDTELREVSYSVSTGGNPFPGLQDVLEELDMLGVEIYVASGDSMRSLFNLAEYIGIRQDHIYPVSTPRQKEEIVLSLKEDCDQVIMVGDGLNDLYALKAADLGVLTVQQDSYPSEELFQAANRTINEIVELPALLKKEFFR